MAPKKKQAALTPKEEDYIAGLKNGTERDPLMLSIEKKIEFKKLLHKKIPFESFLDVISEAMTARTTSQKPVTGEFVDMGVDHRVRLEASRIAINLYQLTAQATPQAPVQVNLNFIADAMKAQLGTVRLPTDRK